MSVRHLNRLACFITVTAGFGGPLAACSKEEAPPASPASVEETATFRFAPPDGTEYVRTDRRSEEIAIVGVPLRRAEEEELRWKIGVDQDGKKYSVQQDLVYISYARDGQTFAQGKVDEGISAELVLDDSGNLKEVKGLDKTADTLRKLIMPGHEAEAEQMITPESLEYLVASRYKVLFGDTIGRPAEPGSTWTIKSPPGSFIASRTVKVTRHEACGNTTCALLHVAFELDPQVVTDRAMKLVRSRVVAAGGDPARVNMRRATYGMSGSMLIEPATMLSHGASLVESGTVTVADATEQEISVEIKGTTEISYAYSEESAAAEPPGARFRTAGSPSETY